MPPKTELHDDAFSSRGVRARNPGQGVLGETLQIVKLSEKVGPPVLSRISRRRIFDDCGEDAVRSLLAAHSRGAQTVDEPPTGNVSAGKNTYTYDAHTYHTKVPPQGIAHLIRHYLPLGGLVLDPFAGSGMTGVAARVVGVDCILNELSPAACFIASRFTSSTISAMQFEAAVKAVLDVTAFLRHRLYTTTCRECHRSTELLYTVWSYRVLCSTCGKEFQIWDQCRSYGRTVREHRILTEFPCPNCQTVVKKSRLARTASEPVLVAYKCCGSKQQEVTHLPNAADIELIHSIEENPPLEAGFFPTTAIPDGVNLRQPKRHGLDRIDKFYTRRNLAALSHLWKAIHRLESPQLAAQVAFVFTSLYQRVTRMSEFRFWGGSGNTAHFNVPFISDEPNVFVAFERKARTIQDHLETTAAAYRGTTLVVNGSATALTLLPDESVDLVFTDPPFGANINYSEMNILWESWLGEFTDNGCEAIINRSQGKGVREYQALMVESLKECYRVLRSGHWMLLVFMNSSAEVWKSIRTAIQSAGFEIIKMDIFDKRHGTFKQFVSENTAGMDLVLHCRKSIGEQRSDRRGVAFADIRTFLSTKGGDIPTSSYLHVNRVEEIDFRTLYSEWLAQSFTHSGDLVDFASFREIAQRCLKRKGHIETSENPFGI